MNKKDDPGKMKKGDFYRTYDPREKDKDGSYWIDDYKVISITPIAGFVAVFRDGDGTDGITVKLEAIGVAEITVRQFRDGEEVQVGEVRNEVVGFECLDGLMQIVDEASNFIGICRSGEDYKALWGLPYLKKPASP